MFFLDYLSFTAFDEHRLEMLMRGMVWGCREAGCALIGGETAQLPGVYADADFDLAGFVVGAVERGRLLDGSGVVPGDRLIGIPSSGVHTNGFSLVRRVFNLDDNPAALFRPWPGLERNLGRRADGAPSRLLLSAGAAPGSDQSVEPHYRRGIAGQNAGVIAGQRGRRVPYGFLAGAANLWRNSGRRATSATTKCTACSTWAWAW